MPLWKRLVQLMSGRSVASLVDDLAQACRSSVALAVEGRLATMTPDEARGYIRAKTTPIVRLKSAAMVWRYGTRWGDATVQELATERVVAWLDAEFAAQRRMAALRRAA